MPFTTTTIGGMEKRLTLQDIIIKLDYVIAVANDGFAATGRRMDNLESRMGALESRMSTIETQMESLEGRTLSLEKSVDSLERKTQLFDYHIGELESHMRVIDSKVSRIEPIARETRESVENLHQEMRGVHKVLDRFNGRITHIEEQTGLIPKAA